MKTFNANFTQCKNSRSSAPALLAVFHFAPGDVFVSDRKIAAGTDGPVFQGLVSSWGKLSSPGNGLFAVGLPQMKVELLNTGDRPFSTYLEGVTPESVEVELYLWFEGLDYGDREPLGRFTIASPVQYSGQKVKLSLVSAFIKRNCIVGKTINRDDYPGADPEAVGKVENIIYGTPRKVPCQPVIAGAASRLVSDVTGTQTVGIELSMAPDETAFPISGTLQLDSERISYTGILNRVLTGVTRGVSGTAASAHKKGATAFEVRSDYTYLVAGHPVRSIGDVYVGGVRVISGVTRLTDDGGKAKLVFASKFTLEKSVSLSVSQGSHSHQSYAGTKAFFANPYTPSVAGTWNNNCCSVDASQNLGPIESVLVRITMRSNTVMVSSDPQFHIRGTGLAEQTTHFPNSYAVSITRTFATTINAWGVWSIDSLIDNGLNYGAAIDAIEWVVTYDPNTAASPAYGVSLTGNSAADIVVGGLVTCDVEGYQDDISGTFTGTSLNLIDNPADVLRHFMQIYMGLPHSEVDPSFDAARTALSTTVSGGYAFAGVIDGKIDALNLIESLSTQSRLKLMHDGYSARLKFIANDAAPADMTLGSPDIIMSSLAITRTGKEEVVNTLDLHYQRDFARRGTSAADYMQVAASSALYPAGGDAGSVAAYGPMAPRRPFLFGFIADGLVASDLRDFYITRFKDVKRRCLFTVPLYALEIEEGDVLALDYSSSCCQLQGAKFYVEDVVFIPGSAARGRADTIQVQAVEVEV